MYSWFTQKIHKYDNHFTQAFYIYSLWLVHVFFCPEDLFGGEQPHSHEWLPKDLVLFSKGGEKLT